MALFDHKFFRPSTAVYGSPKDMGLVYEAVSFAAQHGPQLNGWLFTATNAKGTIVHCHGNGGNITGHYACVSWAIDYGFNALCFDYRGYGESEGRPTRAGVIADAHAAVDYVQSRDDLKSSVLLFGQSLGGAIAIVLAARRSDIAGCAVDGPFSDYQKEVHWVCRQHWLTYNAAGLISKWGVSRGHDPIDVVQDVAPTPLFLMHGKEDRVCPWEMSQDLYDKAEEPKGLWLIDGAGHYQIMRESPEIAIPKLTQFFDSCVQAQQLR